MELEQLLKGKVSGFTNKIAEKDIAKGIKQYIYMEVKGFEEIETGNQPTLIC